MATKRGRQGGKKRRRGKTHPRGKAGDRKASPILSEVEKILAKLQSGLEASPEDGGGPDKLIASIAEDAPRIKAMAADCVKNGRHGTAERLLRNLAPYTPQDSDLWSRLGDLFSSRGIAAGAVGSYRKARLTAAEPDANVALRLSVLYRDMGYDALALELAREAADYSPSPEARLNLALCLKRVGRHAEAIAALDLIGAPILAQHPGLAEEREELELQTLDEGAAWRRRHERDCAMFCEAGASVPYWNGEPESRLLVDCRCSLSDVVMAMRFVPVLRQRGHEVTLRCPEPLCELFACFGLDAVCPVRPGKPGWPAEGFDAVCSPRSLPHVFDVATNGVPDPQAPTLPPETRGIGLPETSLLKVGIVWAGEDLSPMSQYRVAPPAMLFSLALEFDRMIMASFQKGEAAESLVKAGGDLLIANVAPAVENFVTLAALLKSLDVAIMADSALGHLAAVQGVPVIMLLDAVPRQVWGKRGRRTHWYPSMRLLRQTGNGGWDSVFVRLRGVVAALVEERTRAGERWAPARCLEIIDKTLGSGVIGTSSN